MSSKDMATVEQNKDLTFSSMDEAALAIMEQDSENYVDDTAQEDLAMPRLVLLQSNSGQCKKSDPKFIKGAEEGDLCNTLTNEVFEGDKGLLFVPVKRRVVYLHWTDVDAGGGLIENFGDDPTEYLKIEPNEKGKRRTSATTEIVKTHETFGYIVDVVNKRFTEVVMALASTQEKKQRRFNSLIRSLVGKNGKTLPEYAGVYKITTTPESNDSNSWYTFEFTAAGYTLAIPEIGKPMYEAAKNFAEMIKKDDVNMKYEQDLPEENVEVDADAPV